MSLNHRRSRTRKVGKRLPFLVGAALGCLALQARAEPAPLYEALVEQAATAPSLVEAGALVDAAEARVAQANSRPNPEVSVEIEDALGSGPFEGISRAETTVSVSQDLELFGRRDARVGVARAEREVADARQRAARVDLPVRIALAYAEAEAAERRAVLARESLDLAIADARSALVLVETGREPLLRGIQGQAEAAQARATYDQAVAERDAALARLTAVSASPRPITSIRIGILDRVPLPSASESPASTPAVATLEAEVAAAERRIRVEQIRGRPNVRATAGIRRFEAENAVALVGGVSVQLPLFDQNRGNVSAAQAELRAAQARLQAARLEAEGEFAGARARLAASGSRVSAADEGVTAAAEAYRLTRIGFEEGRLSALEVRTARSGLVQARTTALDARLSRARAEAELARLSGRRPFESR